MLDSRRTRVVAGVLLLLTIATRANAYIDFGSGSMLWQSLVAGFLGFMFVFAGFWRRVFSFLSRRRSPSQDDSQSSEIGISK